MNVVDYIRGKRLEIGDDLSWINWFNTYIFKKLYKNK
jgi:hypothetical protein